MGQGDSRLARACAELIRLWHEKSGIALRPPNMDDGAFNRYRDRLEYFHKADLADTRLQEEIAREQGSGVFEWYYGAIVPVGLWNEVLRKYEASGHAPPKHLGEVANWIREALQSATTREAQEEQLRRKVQAETPEKLVEEAQKFYADVVAGQTRGVGGVNVLISCCLERYPWRDGDSLVTLLQPEALGLRLVAMGERVDDIVDALRLREIIVEEVIGGPTAANHDPDRHDNG